MRSHQGRTAAAGLSFILALLAAPTTAQNGARVLDSDLLVRTVVSGLDAPVAAALIGPGEFLVTEKNTGRVRHVRNGRIVRTVLDLAVNTAGERGLLGITTHPEFAANRYVYLYRTCSAAPPLDRSRPSRRVCTDPPETGSDTRDPVAVPLLGHRVDRFVWTGSRLVFDRRIIALRAFQNDATNGGPFANHNGGVIRFGPDGRLYVTTGDVGRRGQFQNLPNGPFGPGERDDQFGGPEPDNAHLTSVVLRLADDGTTPVDNPFFAAGAQVAGEAGANIQRTFAYGLRNSFGMAFDPIAGHLWLQDNGDDSFDEINLVEPGANLGWVQIMGPVDRIAQFRSAEAGGIQQRRWSATRIATSPAEALSRLFMLPGAHYADPQFSWRFVVPPGGIGFTSPTAFGPSYPGDLIVGGAGDGVDGGPLLRFRLRPDRRGFSFTDPRLSDGVADNRRRADITQSESLRWGSGFGTVTDVLTGADGTLFAVSISHGAVYSIGRREPLPPGEEPPPIEEPPSVPNLPDRKPWLKVPYGSDG